MIIKLLTKYALFYELSCWSSEGILKSFILIYIEKRRLKNNVEIIIKGEPIIENVKEEYIKIESPLISLKSRKFKPFVIRRSKSDNNTNTNTSNNDSTNSNNNNKDDRVEANKEIQNVNSDQVTMSLVNVVIDDSQGSPGKDEELKENNLLIIKNVMKHRNHDHEHYRRVKPSISIERKRSKTNSLVATDNTKANSIMEKGKSTNIQSAIEDEEVETDEVTAQNTFLNSKLTTCDLSINIIYKNCKRPKSPEKSFSKRPNDRKKRSMISTLRIDDDYFKASKVKWSFFKNEDDDNNKREKEKEEKEKEKDALSNGHNDNHQQNKTNSSILSWHQCKSILKSIKRDNLLLESLRLKTDDSNDDINEKKEIIEIKKFIYKDDADYVYIHRGTKSRPIRKNSIEQ